MFLASTFQSGHCRETREVFRFIPTNRVALPTLIAKRCSSLDALKPLAATHKVFLCVSGVFLGAWRRGSSSTSLPGTATSPWEQIERTGG
jgi:hypothetical protein